MLDANSYGHYDTAWCPGCGNHDILAAVKQALALCDLPPERVVMVSGIGQAAKAPQYLRANVFNGLHGRSLPVATGIRLANPELTVLVESGDGCLYGEGGNHFLATMRRNIDITIIAHNNGIYGLTKGQASPTSTSALSVKSHPYGINSSPFNAPATAVIQGATFVGRGFSGDKQGLPRLIAEAVRHPGVALLDVLTPCVSFNKINTFAWYKKRCTPVPPDHDPTDKYAALKLAEHWEDAIFTGVLYRRDNVPVLESRLPAMAGGPLMRRSVNMEALCALQKSYM